MVSSTTPCYSEDAVVDAIRDFYQFLTNIFLDEPVITESPLSGWPDITVEAVKVLGKTEEVAHLLRRLPQFLTPRYFDGRVRYPKRDGIILFTEGHEYISDYVPEHLVGLTSSGGGGYAGTMFLLDTKLGIVHWVECPGTIKYDKNIKQQRVCDDGSPFLFSTGSESEAEEREERDDAEDVEEEDEEGEEQHDGCDEDEEEGEWEETWSDKVNEAWGNEACGWLVTDFFGVLKDQYRALNFIPCSAYKVLYNDDRNFTHY
ncbi:hypothetical protein QBC38DRAFT_501402 [Podospora fimiseda]|uniref:Uncharacterized protein n=1 Tax=Podospora fimiseda TaxID=252190 RepID=A0AAN7BKX9_9PEZI|nr:hypothetical protein QBC38DRAFT_501402 [Podospora fimiseda]